MKKSFKITLFLIIQLFFCNYFNVFSQFVPTILDVNNVTIRSKAERVESSGWLYFDHSSNMKPGDLFLTYKNSTGLGLDDRMIIKKEWEDKYGWKHVRYQQLHKDIKVEEGEWSEHWRDCFVEISHGKLIENLNINDNPTYSEAQALANALSSIGATEYAWENQDWEIAVKWRSIDPFSVFIQ